MAQVNSWKTYYQSHPGNEDANKHVSAFANNSTVDAADIANFGAKIIKAVLADIDTVVLAKSPTSNALCMYHSFTNLGGTRARPENKIVGLLGSGPDATAIVFNEASLKQIVEVDCPTNATLRGLSDKASVTTAPIAPTRPLKLHNAAIQFLPPFVSSPFLEIDAKDPAQLLIELNGIVSAYDTEHNGDADFPNATDHCKFLRCFLWAATNGHIPTIVCAPDPDDAELQTFKTSRSGTCILPSIVIADPDESEVRNTEAVQQLAVNVQNQTDLIEELKKGREESRLDKKQKFDDLHDSSKRLILNASSQNGEVAAAVASSTCLEFYKKSSAAKAGNFLIASLKDTYGCHPDFETGFLQAIHDGHYLRDREDSPSNFSFFLCPRMQPLSAGNRARSTILQIKNKQGKGWTEKDYDDAVKQGISTPGDINTMTHQLKIWWGCGCFLFGDNSRFPKSISNLLQLISRYCITFEAQQLNDKNFFTKFGYQLDTRVFRWLQQCELEEDREKVDDSLLDFQPLVQAVLNDQFIQVLPCTFRSSEDEEEDNGTRPSDGRPKKKKKRVEANQGESQLDRNTGKLESWIVSKELYQAKFAGRNLDKRPTLHGRPMCQRYHSKGHCFTDCINAVTHIPSTSLPEVSTSAYTTYCQLCTTAN